MKMTKPTENYKNYSLKNLEEWLHDSLNSEATVDEIYNTIVKVIKNHHDYHQSCAKLSKDLLNKFYIFNYSDSFVDPYKPDLTQFWSDPDIADSNSDSNSMSFKDIIDFNDKLRKKENN